MQRQMELLKKAGRAPRCEYVYTDGRGCRAPQVKGERWCHGHAKMMSYRPEKLELEPMEDEQAVMVNLYRVTKSLLAGRITEKTAGLMLWSVAIGMPGAGRLRKLSQPQKTRRKDLPLINTDDTDQKKQLANGNWQLAKPKAFEPQRTQRKQRKGRNHSPQMNTDERRSERGGASRNLDGSHPTKPTMGLVGTPASTPRNTGASLTMTNRSAAKSTRRGFVHPGTPPQPANVGPSGDPGVTNAKSFNSGVEGRVPPRNRRSTASPGQVATESPKSERQN
jgi:hypothetical protein